MGDRLFYGSPNDPLPRRRPITGSLSPARLGGVRKLQSAPHAETSWKSDVYSPSSASPLPVDESRIRIILPLPFYGLLLQH